MNEVIVTSVPAWSPYLVGALIGVLSMFTFYFSNKAIGVSSGYANLVGILGGKVAPGHIHSLKYYQDHPPKINWELTFVLAIAFGAFLAAWTGGEFSLESVPRLWEASIGDDGLLRWGAAFSGGILMALGSRIGGGCTSGHGISGALQLSVGSWIALLGFFVGGTLIARLLYY